MNPPTSLQTVILSATLINAAVFLSAPNWSRATYWFSVTVTPEFRDSDVARAILLRYRLAIAAGAILAAFVGLLPAAPPTIGLPAGLLLHFAAFVWARHASLPYAVEQTTRRAATLGEPEPSAWWLAHVIGPVLILGAASGFLATHYDRIPDRLPQHWNARGVPDRWTTKTPGRVYRLPATGGAVTLSIGLTLCGLLWQTRGAPHRLRLVRRLLAGTTWFLAGIFTWIALHPYPLGLNLGAGFLGVVLLPTGIAVALVLRQVTAENGEPDETAPAAVPTRDGDWKLSLLYFAPQDPALLVERRFGYGFDLNFARPLAWMIIGCALAPVAISLLSLTD